MSEDKRVPKSTNPKADSLEHSELSERFSKSAEVVNFNPSGAYEAPPTMALPSDDED